MNKRHVVVITGASAGVGRATVLEFAKRHCAIGLIARGHEGLEAAKREVEQLGGTALVLAMDVADPEAMEAAADRIERELGPINVWVNNAMASVFSPIAQTEPGEFRRVSEVTYLGTVYGTLAALRRMSTRNRGMIVQVGSALAYRSIPLQAAYCAAKHAIKGFTESLRSELAHDHSKVQVTMVNLPAVNTPQFGWVKSRLSRKAQPVPPIFQPEVAAEAIYHASAHYRREWWIGTPTVLAIVGNKFVPGLIDRYLGRTGYNGQQTAEPEDPGRPDNLWKPVPGDAGAHGVFDQRAHSRSYQAWLARHYLVLTAAVSVLAVSLSSCFLRGPLDRRSPSARERPQ